MHALVHQCAGRVEKNRPELVYMSGTCKWCTRHVSRRQNMSEGGGACLSRSGRVGGSQYASVRVEGGRSVSGRGWRTWRTRGTCWGAGACGRYIQEGGACRTASGMHGAHRMGPGDMEPGRGACRKGGACPRGAEKVIGRGLGAGHVVGVWDVLGGLSAHVGWVEGPSKRGGVYPGRAEPVR